MEQNTQTPEQETVNPEQENALLKQMEAVDQAEQTEPDFDPELAKQSEAAEAEQHEMATQGAQMTAYMGLAAIEMAIQSVVHPRFKLPEHNRDEVIQNCAPVLIKYGALVPEWLANYQEEIAAVKALGSLGMASYGEIKRLQAEDKALQAKNDSDDETETSQTDSVEQEAA